MFAGVYNDNKILNYQQANEVFTINKLLDSLYEPIPSLPSNKTLNMKKAAFHMTPLLVKAFNNSQTLGCASLETTINKVADLYYMRLSVYDGLKKQLDEFLQNSGAHDIDFIIENTTGFILKAYFSRKALNDLGEAGVIIIKDIGKNPDDQSESSENTFIYQHKNSKRPMKSTEVDID
jgi:hypothetical protein